MFKHKKNCKKKEKLNWIIILNNIKFLLLMTKNKTPKYVTIWITFEVEWDVMVYFLKYIYKYCVCI